MPLVALFLGVLVAGLGIGAALSFLNRAHGDPGRRDVALATSLPTEIPVRAATPLPSVATDPPATPSPKPVKTPVPKPTPRPSATASAAASAMPSPAPSAAGTPTASPEATTAATEPSAATSTPAATTATAVPKPKATHTTATAPPASAAPASAAPVATTAAASPAARGEAPTSAFSLASAAVVRQYLNALTVGDEATARDTLVDGRGDLPEMAILDGSSRIRGLVAHGTDDTSEVTLVIETPTGNFSGHYFLVRSPSGNPQIRAHDISKL